MDNIEVKWNEKVRKNYDRLIEKIPVFMRSLAEQKVLKKLDKIVKNTGCNEINEKELVDAFFEATPFGFHGPMKADMEELGIDYVKYGHDK